MENRKVLADTSLLIDYLRNADKHNSQFIQLFKNHNLHISVISVFELLNGATTESKMSDINKLCKNLGIIDFNLPCAEKASEIYRELKRRNKMIEFRDILIGATALVHDIPIATLNVKHFERISGIQII